MKELSIEQKAKAYDEALKKAQEAANNGYVSQNFVSDIFPELKESDGEKIRKKIIALFKGQIPYTSAEDNKKFVAWLEKQGEHANFRNKIQIGDKVTRNKDGVLVNLSQLKRVAKPSDDIDTEKQGKIAPTEEELEALRRAAYEPTKNWSEKLQSLYEKLTHCEQGKEKPVNTDYVSGIRKELLSIEDNAENVVGLTESQWVAIRAAHRLLGEYIDKVQNTWSEEDELSLKQAIYVCHQNGYTAVENWLKSLKDKYAWKPSEAQLVVLDDIIKNGHLSNANETILNGLCNDLKKL